MDRDDTDEALMLRYRDGDASAFEALYARHKGPLYRYLLRQCGNQAIADELFQEVWLALIRTRAGYAVRARFTTWLYRLAHHRLLDHYRRQGRAALESFAGDCPDPDQLPAAAAGQPEQQEDRRRQAQRLLEALAQLPAAQRQAFLLHAEAGLSLEAIAEATGVGRETVKSRLRYALGRLRRLLEGAA
ncbi:MAG: RNA polymerase sigma factor [Pseudomonadota bacterium]|nr:RNA polymerase sigma factor [Pseudomonadota bacterium]